MYGVSYGVGPIPNGVNFGVADVPYDKDGNSYDICGVKYGEGGIQSGIEGIPNALFQAPQEAPPLQTLIIIFKDKVYLKMEAEHVCS